MTAGALLFMPDLLKGHPLMENKLAGDNTGLRFRQVHLDFHTSPLIEDVGAQFDPEQFAATLKRAHVNSVTVFGRCHHGYIYHDSQKFADRKHPYLKRNLLKEQIEACHKVGIRTPIYLTVQWDYLTAQQHPEWLIRDENGAPVASGDTNRFHPGFYNHLCVLSPYIDFLKSYVSDLFEQVPVDGLFLDIHHCVPNANEYCVAAMIKQGIDPTKEHNRYLFYKEVLRRYKEDMTAHIRTLDKTCSIFYNGGHVGPQVQPTFASNTHFELESLPSGGWGYLHFPLTARYARNFDKDVLGMTGKFHTSWGDFHSLKNKAALEFETSMMLALNAGCSIGDQLHPRGVLDKATYDLIEGAYELVEQKEPWCVGAKALTEVGVFSTEEFATGDVRQPLAMLGAVKLLQEGAVQFDIIDSHAVLDRYKVLVLPDNVPLSDDLKTRVQSYLAKGGTVLASFESGLTPDKKAFALEEWGVDLIGVAPYSPDYIRTQGKIAKGLPDTELVMYEKGLEVKTRPGATVLVNVDKPYFNREWNHFSSHKHTPSSGEVAYPGIVQQGKVIYFMHPIFTQYAKNAPVWCKKLVLNALDILLPNPKVRHNGPTSLTVVLNEQPAQKREVLHLLHYIPERKGIAFDIVEDIIPLYNVSVSIHSSKKVSQVKLVPQGKKLPFTMNNGRIEISVPEVRGHQMLELG